MTWVSHYIPFDRSRLTVPAHPCWGLVHLVLREQAGVETPDYGEIAAGDLARAAQIMSEAVEIGQTWLPVHPSTPVREFDVARMWGYFTDADGRRRRADIHVGVVTPDRTLLHIRDEVDAVQVPLDHYSVRSLITGVFRHRELA